MRALAGVPLGAVFVGCTLIPALPAFAADTGPDVVLKPERTTVAPGETASLTLRVTGADDEKTCLYDATADAGFSVGDLSSPRAPARAEVTGAPEESGEVTATVTYAVVDEDADCKAAPEDDRKTASSAPAPVTVTSPDPTPTPSPTPTEDPDPSPSPTDPPEEPSPSPTPTEDPDPSPSPTEDPDPTPTEDPDPTSTEGTPSPDPTTPSSGGDNGGPESGGGSGDGDGGGPPSSIREPDRDEDDSPAADRPAAPPHSPVSTSDFGGGGADRPSLPTGDLDLPSVDPDGPSDDLADLPMVEPGEEDGDDASTVAAEADDGRGVMSPSVLLLFLLLLLLLSAPLAPVRRVRTGTAYKGRRRRG
ncbi:outer membrane biosynthesis protein TonB [Spinactinospora alkalitolerans]|uniref:Outer membrane biosynthesis protein TonB n=1 Tax=Spinactinospora alkalitolerans TaxID=687207 RepID=A0A852TQY2_9ACTN|nr:hypothetical protein [Spinactinospora alkalitolerans]NYE45083.1 outer membrane biosynthesis protein TonB [Spinactinospora alkalitolerans]